jgi:uncharacterized membrane protein YkoI
MKKLSLLLAATALTVTAGIAQAKDVSPEQAVALLNAGTIQPFEKLNEAVLAQHPDATIHDTELEEKNGIYVYEVEVRDAAGVEWDLKLNAADGSILKNERDD